MVFEKESPNSITWQCGVVRYYASDLFLDKLKSIAFIINHKAVFIRNNQRVNPQICRITTNAMLGLFTVFDTVKKQSP